MIKISLKKKNFATINCRICGAFAGQFEYTEKVDYQRKVKKELGNTQWRNVKNVRMIKNL